MKETSGIGAGRRGVDLCCCNGAGARFLVRLHDLADVGKLARGRFIARKP